MNRDGVPGSSARDLRKLESVRLKCNPLACEAYKLVNYLP